MPLRDKVPTAPSFVSLAVTFLNYLLFLRYIMAITIFWSLSFLNFDPLETFFFPFGFWVSISPSFHLFFWPPSKIYHDFFFFFCSGPSLEDTEIQSIWRQGRIFLNTVNTGSITLIGWGWIGEERCKSKWSFEKLFSYCEYSLPFILV